MDKTALLKKIRALAEHGVGGEAENAEKLLARMMKKYGISEAELDEETRVRHDFTYHGGEEKKILRQVVYKVTGGYTYELVYATNGKEILHGVDLTIRPGSVTALVGPSGSGKSTIAKLIAGFWDVSGGSILLGGQELKNIPQRQLAGMIAYVSQDNYLFDENIRENIRMGRRGATDADVENVARAAGCHDFIMSLEHGYDTVVGGAGGHLSGGERQRIAIARAMLKDAPIVILDEATAYLDPENEASVQSAIGWLVAGKTLIVIAHRLSTVTNSDQIVVVKDGRIEASGTHEELRACSKLYQQMWNAHIGAKDGE